MPAWESFSEECDCLAHVASNWPKKDALVVSVAFPTADHLSRKACSEEVYPTVWNYLADSLLPEDAAVTCSVTKA